MRTEIPSGRDPSPKDLEDLADALGALHIAVDLHIRLRDTGEAVKWLRAMTAETLTLTPEGYYSRFGYMEASPG